MRDRLSDVLPPRTVADAELLTSELVTNAVLHARLDEGDPVAIESEAAHTEILSVIDAGAEFRLCEDPPRAAEPTGGRGLFLVESVADRWGIDDSPPHSVWFEIGR